MAEQAKIMTLHDHDTGEAIAPRTDVKALSGEGKKWNYVGFTEDNQLGLIEGTWPCNKNFLINSYFVGGGSQKGNSQFPINQRGKTEFASVSRKIFIDKWYVLRSSWALESEGLSGKKDDSENNGGISYLLEGEWRNKSITLSAIIDGELMSLSGVSPAEYNKQIYKDFGKVRLVFQPSTPVNFVTIYFYDTEYHVLTAAKLELGDTQTLAHKEGDTWVLNEIPNYATELMKCQRYYQVFKTSSMRPVEAEDFRPVMRARPALETISIGGQTYYTADANL